MYIKYMTIKCIQRFFFEHFDFDYVIDLHCMSRCLCVLISGVSVLSTYSVNLGVCVYM